MIFLVCPSCRRAHRSARTKMTIIATSWVQIVLSRDAGIEQAIAQPIRRESTVSTRILPAEKFICPRCNTEAAVEKWKYIVVCDQCGDNITEPLKDPSEVANAQVCRDTRTIYCHDCWPRVNLDYCGECRFHSECVQYNR